ncbi:P-loop NTPase fold protein [Verrucomicrobiota bacterium]
MTGFKRHNENEINPDDIWGDDAFGKLQQYAKLLTNALTDNNLNFVLNVNGAWGTGKSFYVQRWSEDLRQKKYPVVTFNAWANDSTEDPLAPLISSVLEQQESLLPAPLATKIKRNCGKFLFAGGGLIVRAGLKQLVGEKGIDEINDLLSSGTENELIKLAGNYVDEQLEKQKASAEMANVLEEFINSINEGETHNSPIFIFIDELDRCRPTFAIELLERVKHLFNVNGIKFIISTDTEQLAHSIKAVYGHDFDAKMYLQRFFDQTFTLPQHSPEQFSEMLFNGYFNNASDSDQWFVDRSPHYTFGKICAHYELTLREQQQVFRRLTTIIPTIPTNADSALHFSCLCLLIILRMKDTNKLKELDQKSEHYPHTSIGGFWHITLYINLMKCSKEALEKELESHDSSYFDNAAKNSKATRIMSNWYTHFHITTKYKELVELTESIF